jgi:hypothetical protein
MGIQVEVETEVKVEMGPRTGYFATVGFWLLAFGFWLLAFGFWLLAFGFWLLAFGFWQN